jgi:hypothetical protein
VKIRPLPITDLARISTMEPPLRLHALKQVKSGGGSGSYEPTRNKLPDIVNRQPGAFASRRTSWERIERDLARLSKSPHEERMNKTAAKAIFRYCNENGIEARELDGFPLTFSIGVKLRCWSPALFLYSDRMAVPFLDMRRTYKLTRDGRRFMFSVMHIALRENNPDYQNVELEILHLRDQTDRSVRLISEKGMRLYTYDELEVMVRETYHLWHAVLEERRDAGRRDKDDWDDGLFGSKAG